MSEFFPTSLEDCEQHINSGQSLQKRYSYYEIHNLVKSGAEKLKELEFKPDCILAIGGGGFIPARILRTHLNIPIYAMSISFYDDREMNTAEDPEIIQDIDINLLKGKKVIIVDEIDDTGKTLKWLLHYLSSKSVGTEYGIFVVHNKNKAKVAHHFLNNNNNNNNSNIPYIACETVEDIWIEYPWD